jgi:hypothetical protein
MNEIRQKANYLERTIEAVIAVNNRQLNPKSDNMKLAEAYRKYGRAWIQYHLKAFNLVSYRHGTAKNSAVYISRAKVAALWAADMEEAHFVSRGDAKK